MPQSRWINTGGAAYTERGSVPHNANRHHYGAANQADQSPATGTSGAQVFAAARHHLDALDAAGVDTDLLRGSISRLEAEVARGEAADGAVVVRALHAISGLVPELGAAVAAGLADPTAGVAPTVRAAVERATGRFGPSSG